MGDTLRRNRDFGRLWAGQSISQLGSQVTVLALPLVAIRILHAGPLEVGALAACETAPFLLVGLPAGVWVDRWRRQPILVVADVARAAALATVPLAYALDVLSMWQLYVVAVVTGVFTVFFDVAYQSYLPALVPRERLVEGNAKLELSRSMSQVAGPGVAGVLVELLRSPYAVAADSVSFAVSALFVARIRTREAAMPASDAREPMRRSIGAGLRYVLRHPVLKRIAACTAMFNLFSAIGMAVFLLYAVDRLGISPAVIGLVFSLGSLGFVLGAALSARLGRVLGVGPALLLAAGVGGAGFLLVPLAPADTAVPFFVVAMFLEMMGMPIYNVLQVSLRQAVTPTRLQGRMNATMRFVVWGVMPLGSLVGGVLGRAFGLRAALWVSGIGTTLSVLPLLGRTMLSLRTIPADGDAAA
ncbi:MAG TPA: MFS transporter [Acidimicrobiales bacterium]|nr:MFS transporter [Acidimicrobiales bacterium]